MGLRIGTNIGALTALRNLRQSGVGEARTLERLSTGLQINRAADNPSGLVLLQQLTSETRRLETAIESTERGANTIQTADAALGEVQNILVDLNAAQVKALNTNSPAEQQALQQFVNQGVDAINRIANTTRFADMNLLNGTRAFQINGASPELTRVDVRSVAGGIPFPQQINVNVLSAATQAEATGTIAGVQPADVTFRVQGNLGTQEVTVQAGATQADVIEAINGVSDFTGVVAVESGADAGKIRSAQVGSDQFVRIENVTGSLAGITEGQNAGTDIVATVDGGTAQGRGNTINVSTPRFSAEVTAEGGATGNFQFTIAGGGLRFQTGTGVTDATVIGFPSVGTAFLGSSSGLGSLSALTTGGSASVTNSPGNAINILRAAQDEVSTLRAGLGATQSNLLESQRRAMESHLGNLTAARSTLGDADFGRELANLSRFQTLRAAGVSVLRASNLTNSSVLNLLGG